MTSAQPLSLLLPTSRAKFGMRRVGLLPADVHAWVPTITWMFAAISTIKPPMVACEMARLLESEKPW